MLIFRTKEIEYSHLDSKSSFASDAILSYKLDVNHLA